MKVLHLVAGLDTGGAEKQLFLLCRHTRGLVNHEVVSLGGEGRWAAPLRAEGAWVSALGYRTLRDPWALASLRRIIASSTADLLHCWLPSVNILGAVANRLRLGRRLPMVASVRNVDDWKPATYRLLERMVSPLWDAVICNSRTGVEFTAGCGIPEERIHFVPNGIEDRPPVSAAEAVQARRGVGLDAHHFVAATVCRLTEHKRVDRFLDIAAHVSQHLESARFLVAGGGPQQRDLERRAERLGLGGRVRFLGQVTDVRAVLAACDVFLLCSDREGMANSVLEAMQAGRAALVTDAGDNRYLVRDGSSGRVLTAAQMGSALLALEANRALLEACGQAAAVDARHYGVPAMSSRTIEVYRGVADRARTETILEFAQGRQS